MLRPHDRSLADLRDVALVRALRILLVALPTPDPAQIDEAADVLRRAGETSPGPLVSDLLLLASELHRVGFSAADADAPGAAMSVAEAALLEMLDDLAERRTSRAIATLRALFGSTSALPSMFTIAGRRAAAGRRAPHLRLVWSR